MQERVVPCQSWSAGSGADFGPTDRRAGGSLPQCHTLATVTRIVNLGSPTDAGTPIFDEKHYAPQAWQMLHNHWVEDNPGLRPGRSSPGRQAADRLGRGHLGLQRIGLAVHRRGAWRGHGGAGVRIVRRISRSTLVGGIAGMLSDRRRRQLCGGPHRAAGRFPGVPGCRRVRRADRRPGSGARADVRRAAEGRIAETIWGPRLGVRWWRFGAGVLLGLACGTKWSGLYFVVFFGLMSLGFDFAARRQYQVLGPWLGTLRRDLIPTGYALVLIPFGVYLASYAPWFASETAIDRHEVGQSIGPQTNFPLPDAIRSLWHYTAKAYEFHAGLTNSAGNHHPWESKPWAGRCRCGRCSTPSISRTFPAAARNRASRR